METKYNEAELLALDKKMENPDIEIVCPRCGEKLNFRKIGNSCEVKCPTENCLICTLRGL